MRSLHLALVLAFLALVLVGGAPHAGAPDLAPVAANCLTDYCATVNAQPEGNGSGTMEDGGVLKLDCSWANFTRSGTCSYQFMWLKTQATYMTYMNAAPAEGSQLCDASAICAGEHVTTSLGLELHPGDNITVTQGFQLANRTLTVTRTGIGTGTVTSSSGAEIDCGTVCSVTAPYGTVIKLTATPDAGAVFSAWTGACAGKGPACTVTLDTAYPTTTISTNAVVGLASAATPAPTKAPATPRPTAAPGRSATATASASVPASVPATAGPSAPSSSASTGASIEPSAAIPAAPLPSVAGRAPAPAAASGPDSTLILAGAVLAAGLAIGFGLAIRRRGSPSR